MKTKTVLLWLCMVCFGWLCWNCERIQSYSEIPEIHFKKLIFKDSLDASLNAIVKYAVLTFSFIDGDGDLGVMPYEKNPIDGKPKPGLGLSRIHYTWYQKLPDETYKEFEFGDGSISQSSEIPYDKVMDKSEAQNKTLKGTIEIEMEKPSNLKGLDVVRVEFYIVDRAGNKSNIEYTPDFSILSETGTEITN